MSARYVQRTAELVKPGDALPGSDTAVRINGKHFVNGSAMTPPFAAGTQTVVFGLGCFWGRSAFFGKRRVL